MKKNIIHLLLTAVISLLITTSLYAQNPPPPPDLPTGEGGNNVPVGGGAPLGGGIAILVALAAGYGYRIFKVKRS